MPTEIKRNNRVVTMDQWKFFLVLLIPLITFGAAWGSSKAQIIDLYVREQELRGKLEHTLEVVARSERQEAKWRTEVMVKLARIETELTHIKESLSREEGGHAVWPKGYSEQIEGEGHTREVHPPLQTRFQ